ncbi:MAG TPA: ATP synthase subunit I [Steroidobacteraceae bacterium]|nr:ATP synthase subunit I [Steroidobacteraceae bacterium]
MTAHSLNASLALAAPMAALGVIVGRCYFGLLRWSIARYLTAGDGAAQGAALALGRILCAAALLVIPARLGALPLLGAFLGFLAARTWALRTTRGTS